jgi:hypothetical protein
MKSNSRRFFVITAFALASTNLTLTYGATVAGLSGYEVFYGVRSNGSAVGVTFAGWTTVNGNSWYSSASSTGGQWIITANFTGDSGLGSSVNVTGGRWYFEDTNGERQYGSLLPGGEVVWPKNLGTDLGCGKGVAVITVPISVESGQMPSQGIINACLDDTHLNKIFPPKVWGTLTIP